VRAAIIVSLLIADVMWRSDARPAIAQTQSGEQKADAYFLEGRGLAAQGKSREAYDKYMEAWKLKRSFALACNMGAVARVLPDKAREAAELLRYCVVYFPPVLDKGEEEKLELAKALLEDGRNKVGVVRVQVTGGHGASEAGAVVFVDGTHVGKVDGDGLVQQLLSASDVTLSSPDVFVEPGIRMFSARLGECEAKPTQVEVEKGVSKPVELVLKCPEKTASLPVQPEPPWYQEHKDTLTLVAAGLAAGGIALGVGATLNANSKSTDSHAVFNELKAKDGFDACLIPANQARCSEFMDAHDAWQTSKVTAYVGFAVGGAAALTAFGISIFVPSSPGKKNADVKAAFAITPEGGSAYIRGSF
jgi:hypothetical protein